MNDMNRTPRKTWLGKLLRPMESRKVRVALATILAAVAAQYGLPGSEQIILTILGMGASLILGIAHEDNGRWSGSASTQREQSKGAGGGSR